MGIFSRKQEVNLEDFCRDFYDNKIINPMAGGVDFNKTFFDVVVKEVTEADPRFASVDREKLAKELIILRVEVFALAWTHKFLSGKLVLLQSSFTKHYLHEKGRDDIWAGMEHYNNFTESAILHWLTGLGKMNLGFNYSMRNDLSAENIKDAKKLNIADDIVVRVNHRVWSENAWKQRIILEALILALCEKLNFNPRELNEEAGFRLAVIIRGLYEGAKQSWENVKIKS